MQYNCNECINTEVDEMGAVEKLQAVIVGGGQAGLATAYELARRGVGLTVLEAEGRIGDQWRHRWDSLRLFTPARHDALPGSIFPSPPDTFPSKDEMADYLVAYARDARLPVRTGVRALRLARTKGSYIVETTAGVLEAEHVVVATGDQLPKVPAFAAGIDPAVRQVHAGQYRNAAQRAGDVLAAGAGTPAVGSPLEAARAGHHAGLAAGAGGAGSRMGGGGCFAWACHTRPGWRPAASAASAKTRALWPRLSPGGWIGPRRPTLRALPRSSSRSNVLSGYRPAPASLPEETASC